MVGNAVFDYGSTGTSEVSFEGAEGVVANVTGHPETVIAVNGKVISVSNLSVGTYTLNVTTVADGNHKSVSKNVLITVKKADSTLVIGNDIVFDFNGAGSTNVSFANASGVVASVVGQPDAVINVVGNNITVSGLDAGSYILKVSTIADVNHNNVTKTVNITVNKVKTQIAAAAITTTYNIDKYLVITLKDVNGMPLSGAKLNVNLNGVKTYNTDKNGQVKISTKGLVPKNYDVKITFNGNTNCDVSTKDVKVVVKKANVKITAKKKTFKKATKVKKYSITLKNNKNKVMKKVKVTIKVKGKKYTAKTNSKGKATFKIKKLTKKGTYKAKITFAGDKYYNKLTKTVKIKIK